MRPTYPGGSCSISTLLRRSNRRCHESAKEMRQRLNRTLALNASCNPTGGKGLHVVVRWRTAQRTSERKEAKAFAQGVCQWMAHESPKHICSPFRRSCARERSSSIICERSAWRPRGRGAVAAARVTAQLSSMPLTLVAVRGDLDPKRYTVPPAVTLRHTRRGTSSYDAANRDQGARSGNLL